MNMIIENSINFKLNLSTLIRISIIFTVAILYLII